jgi:hypothetical protein
MLNVLLITIPVYDKRDKTVLESVRKINEEGRPDFISISHYHDGKYRCLVLALNHYDDSSAEILATHASQWDKWGKADAETKRYWQENISHVAEVYEVDGSFEMEVVYRIEGIADFITATLWDTTRERKL